MALVTEGHPDLAVVFMIPYDVRDEFLDGRRIQFANLTAEILGIVGLDNAPQWLGVMGVQHSPRLGRIGWQTKPSRSFTVRNQGFSATLTILLRLPLPR